MSSVTWSLTFRKLFKQSWAPPATEAERWAQTVAQKWKQRTLPHSSVLPAAADALMTADVTSSADCGSASLAATSEPAGAGSNQTEPTVKETDGLFSLRGSNASGHTSISSRCTTRFIISSCDGRQKDFRLISLGRIHQSGCFQNSITVGVVSSPALCSFIRAPRRWR